MADAWTDQFDKQFGTAPETKRLQAKADPWIAAFDNAYGGAEKAVKATGRAIGDVIGPAGRFLSSTLEYPIAAGVKYGLGTDVPLEFSPLSAVKQLESPEARALGIGAPGSPLNAQSADFLLGIPAAKGLNLVGKFGLLPAARALGDAEIAGRSVRQLPGIKQAAEFVKTGSSLPKEYRQPAQRLLRESEGEADLRAYLRGQSLGPYGKLPVDAQDAIQTAIERRTIPSLPPEQQSVARALEAEYGQRVAARTGEGIRAHDLGAHIQPLAQEVVAPSQAISVAPGALRYELTKEALRAASEASSLRTQLRGFMHPDARAAAVAELATADRRARQAEKLIARAKTEPKALERSLRTEARQAARRFSEQTRLPLPKVPEEQLGAEAIATSKKAVAFTDRPFTRELRQEAGMKPYGSPAPATLGTGKLGRRVSDPRLTTQEINAAHEAEGLSRFDPVVPAAIKMGEANDARVMHAKIIRTLSEKFGSPTTDPNKAVARHFGTSTGFTPAMRRKLESTALPKELDELVGNLNKRLSPTEYGGFTRAVYAINRDFKKWAVFSPGFISRNVQNNIFQGAIFGNMNPRTYRDAIRVATAEKTGKGMDAIIRVGKKDMKISDYIQDTIRRGVAGRGQTAQEITGKMYAPGMGTARSANQLAEDVSRRAFDLWSQGKGLDPIKAAERVDDIFFNYSQKLSSGARARLGRTYVPFVNWSTFIGPLTVRTALERPGSAALVAGMRERQNAKEGYSDNQKLATDYAPWNVEQGVVATGKDRGLVPQFAGQYSVNDWVPTSVSNAVDNTLSKLYPTLGVTAAQLRGQDPLTGKRFEEYGKSQFTTAPSSLRAIFLMRGGKEFADAHGITIDPTTKKVIAPARLVNVLRGLPQLRLPNLVADWIAGVKGKEETTKSFLYGVREVPKYERNK